MWDDDVNTKYIPAAAWVFVMTIASESIAYAVAAYFLVPDDRLALFLFCILLIAAVAKVAASLLIVAWLGELVYRKRMTTY